MKVLLARVAPLLLAATALLPVEAAIAAPSPTVDGQAAGGGSLGPGGTMDVVVAGRGGVPASGVDAVAVNVTVTNPTAASYLTVWPSGSSRPTSSNLNFVAGQTTPNMVIAKVGPGGAISVFNAAGDVDVIVDVLGWFPTGAGLVSGQPARLLDSRPGHPTVDGQFAGQGQLGGAQTTNLTVAGRAGVPSSGVEAVVLNVTTTEPTLPSYLTVWPAGASRPTASSVNLRPGATVPNLVIARVGAAGQVSLFNLAGATHLVVDVLGWFPSGSSFVGLTPARLLDTRPGFSTADFQLVGGGALAGGSTLDVRVTGRGGVPASGVRAVAVNATATDPSTASYVTAWPTGSPRPATSNLNVVAGQTVANLVIVPVGDAGQISLYNLAGSTHLVLDVVGWFPTNGSFRSVAPGRLLDTRRWVTAELLIENQYADVTGDGVPAARRSGDTRLAAHDIDLKGVPGGYDWHDGARLRPDRQVWNDYSHTNLWYHVYIREGDSTPMDVRVELRNPRILQKRADGTWSTFVPGGGVGGAYYNGAVANDVPWTAGDWRREPSGSYSVRLAPLGTPGKDTAHGWYGDWPRLPFEVGAATQALVYLVDMRLVDDAGNPVRNAGAKYAGAVGADVFRGAWQRMPSGDVGIPRYRVLTGDWQTLSLTNMSPETIRATPLPPS
jgi:hypothetical protein